MFPRETAATSWYNCTGPTILLCLYYILPSGACVAPSSFSLLQGFCLRNPLPAVVQDEQQNLRANSECVDHNISNPPIHFAHGNAQGRRAQGETDEAEVRVCASRPMMRDLSFTLCWLFTRLTCIYLWWSSLPHAVLSLPSSGSLIIVRLSVTHTHWMLTPALPQPQPIP